MTYENKKELLKRSNKLATLEHEYKNVKTRTQMKSFLQDIFIRHRHIGLEILGGCASWDNQKQLTPEEWKHIGYVSAIAWAYNIEKLNLKEM